MFAASAACLTAMNRQDISSGKVILQGAANSAPSMNKTLTSKIAIDLDQGQALTYGGFQTFLVSLEI